MMLRHEQLRDDLTQQAGMRGALRLPGLPMLAPNVERHPVPGGGSRLIALDPGDEITVVDVEGMQACELLALTAAGRAEPRMLDPAVDAIGPPVALRGLLHGPQGQAFRAALAARGASLDELNRAQGIRLFGDLSRAGASASFISAEAGTLVVAAPGEVTDLARFTPPTEIVVYVHRAQRRNDKPDVQAPTPLADPLADVNIAPGNAHAYVVKAGQYIQLVDVKGRECTDFQAFSVRALDKGVERDIDPTTTRTIYGTAYPMPGLRSKYFSVDQEALVQVVQDTCGQHDTFGLACSARYYDDMGYPGHVNCSDNMTAALEPYGIGARAGWPAINFFFNTAVDDTHAVLSDEPWSRPGDYVLMRALTDLVCVSTACPSDIGPANAWNPTDIQVRVYDAKEDFKPAVAYRMTTDADAKLTRETGFHDSFAAHTRNFVESSGFWLPQDFTGRGTVEEYWSCREKVAVMDMSGLRKFEVLGPDAEALMQLCVTRNVRKLAVGQCVYTAMCYEHGGMIDDGIVFRLDQNNFRWIGGGDTSGIWLREQAELRGMDAWVKSSTDQMCNLAVQGPNSRALLEAMLWMAPTQPTIAELGWFRFSVARLGDFHGMPLVVSRTGYTGELGYELFCHPRDATQLFDALWEAGQQFGLSPLGFAALDMLRIEAGLVIAGHEFDDQTDPFEAGIGFSVPLKSKPDDFIGRDALLARKANPQRQLVGLKINGSTTPVHGDCVRLGRAQVGVITSATRSPVLGREIALARVDSMYAAPGTELEVGQLDGQQKRIPAQVTAVAQFDPGKERVRGDYSSAYSRALPMLPSA